MKAEYLTLSPEHFNMLYEMAIKTKTPIVMEKGEISQWLSVCWTILNKLVAKYIESPIETVEIAKTYGGVCFNNSEFNHPIKFLYEFYLEVI